MVARHTQSDLRVRAPRREHVAATSGLELTSPTLAFTRDGRQLVVARADDVVMHATDGTSRALRIAGVRHLVAFDDELWTVRDQRLEHWTLAGERRTGEIRVARDTILVPTFAGPAVASCGARRWRTVDAEIREEPLAPGAMPTIGPRTLTVERRAGSRIVVLGAAVWRLPARADLVATAALFDGGGLALFLVRAGVLEVWSSTRAGEIRHRISLPHGRVRLAARRGLVVIHDGARVFLFDVRYGRALGTGPAVGEDIAIDPDGRYLAIERDGELVIKTLAHVCAEQHPQRRSPMSDMDETCEPEDSESDLAQPLVDAGGILASGIEPLAPLGVLKEGTEMVKHIEEGDYAHAVSDGLGVGEKGAETLKLLGENTGSAGKTLGVAKGGYDLGMGAAEIATDKDGFGDQSLQGVHDLLKGGSEVAGSGMLGPVAETLGTMFGVGMDVGDAIAPTIFGSNEEDNKAHSEAVPEAAGGGEGQFHASTGNGAVDWIFGAGDYTDGRF